MDDTGRAMARPSPASPTEARPGTSTAGPAPADDADGVRAGRGGPGAPARRLAPRRTRCCGARAQAADWHLVSDAREVGGAWLGGSIPTHTSGRRSTPRLPSLGMVALNDDAALAELAHDRRGRAHAVALGAPSPRPCSARSRRAPRRGARLARRARRRPGDRRCRSRSSATSWEALAALGEPPRPVWAYPLDDEGDEAAAVAGWCSTGARGWPSSTTAHTRRCSRAAQPSRGASRSPRSCRRSTRGPSAAAASPLLSTEAH